MISNHGSMEGKMTTFRATLTVEFEVDGDLDKFDPNLWFERFTDGDSICEFGDEEDGATSFVNSTTLEGIVHLEASPSCACAVCKRDESTKGPLSETNLAETDAWDLAEGR